MSRTFAKTMWGTFAGVAVLAIAVATTAGADEATEALEAAPQVQCTDAKCEACEAGTCSDADCPAKACAETSDEAAKCEACEAGNCDGENCPLKTATAEPKQQVSAAASEANLATPTHRQSKIIKANVENLPKTKLNCFCMTRDGRILAGCGTNSENGEIRVFNSNGDYVETWSTPVQVEAVNIRASDGMIFVAGNGRLVKLDSTGALVADKESPHASVSKEQAAKMREAVITQMKSRVQMYERQAKMYDQQIELVGGQIEKLKEQLAALEADSNAQTGDDAAESDSDSPADAKREALEKQIAQLERSHTSLTRTRKLWSERIEQLGQAEPSDADIQKQLESQISRKLAVASVSAVDDTVYLACSAAVGYGYSVWAIDDDFEKGEEIITDLRGCCGQMDVQASDKGIYVAENSRDRVVCFDHEGEEVRHWGHSAREGIRGFGSCCNPMNVAFGPNSTVYTAESGSGRIKQYSSDGELLQVIGAADLVPGCKKVSIGVSSDGSRVFMLDITRDHIVMMDAIPADERKAMVAKAIEDASAGGDESQATTTSDVQAVKPARVNSSIPLLQLQVRPAARTAAE